MPSPEPDPMPPSTTNTPRRRHYGEFYRLSPLPAVDHRPVVAVIGNCQAESLRLLLDSTGEVSSIRIPAIHEWDAEDLALARHLLARVDLLIMQPVRADYRGLACGTEQLAEFVPAHGRVVRFPVLRYDGLMPHQAIVRSPADPSLNPPVIPYHDLRLLAAARRGFQDPVESDPPAAAYRRLAQLSLAQLRQREQAHDTVVVSDHLGTAPVWHTLNHPDNATLLHLARRVLAAAGLPGEPVAPGRELLGGLSAPVDKRAAAALGVAVSGRDTWSPAKPFHRAHLDFYARHPELVSAGVRRHEEKMTLLELI